MNNSSQELEDFKRNIFIGDVAESIGYEYNRKKSSGRWKMYDSENSCIIVTRTDKGIDTYSYIEGGDIVTGGSIIDFCTKELRINLGQARKYLRAFAPSASSAVHHHDAAGQPSINSEVIAQNWVDMPWYSGRYLQSRGLTEETIRAFDVKQDDRGNACFKHRQIRGQITGWEVKNRNFTGFVAGGMRSLAVESIGTGGVISHLIFTEATIDSMSYYQLHKKPTSDQCFLFISTGGHISSAQETEIAEIIESCKSSVVILAQDNDSPGEVMADQVRAHAQGRSIRDMPPAGKDWNEFLTGRTQTRAASSSSAQTMNEAEAE